MSHALVNQDIGIVLYALFNSKDNRIRGKVNLNKILAKLERIGVSVHPKFMRLQMGSCCQELDDIIDYGISRRWLLKKEVPYSGDYKPRIDIELTEEGKNVIQSEIDYFEELVANKQEIPNIISSIEKKHSSIASQEEHNELLLDDESALKGKCQAIFRKLFYVYEGLGTIDDTSPDLYDVKAMTQYVLFVLNKIQKEYFIPDENEFIFKEWQMGWYYIIYIAEEFSSILEQLNFLILQNKWDPDLYQKLEIKYKIIKRISKKYDIVEDFNTMDSDKKYFEFNLEL